MNIKFVLPFTLILTSIGCSDNDIDFTLQKGLDCSERAQACVVKGKVFDQFDYTGFSFKNVSFVDVNFVEGSLDSTTFENVSFDRVIINGKATTVSTKFKDSSLANVKFTPVIYELSNGPNYELPADQRIISLTNSKLENVSFKNQTIKFKHFENNQLINIQFLDRTMFGIKQQDQKVIDKINLEYKTEFENLKTSYPQLFTDGLDKKLKRDIKRLIQKYSLNGAELNILATLDAMPFDACIIDKLSATNEFELVYACDTNARTKIKKYELDKNIYIAELTKNFTEMSNRLASKQKQVRAEQVMFVDKVVNASLATRNELEDALLKINTNLGGGEELLAFNKKADGKPINVIYDALAKHKLDYMAEQISSDKNEIGSYKGKFKQVATPYNLILRCKDSKNHSPQVRFVDKEALSDILHHSLYGTQSDSLNEEMTAIAISSCFTELAKTLSYNYNSDFSIYIVGKVGDYTNIRNIEKGYRYKLNNASNELDQFAKRLTRDKNNKVYRQKQLKIQQQRELTDKNFAKLHEKLLITFDEDRTFDQLLMRAATYNDIHGMTTNMIFSYYKIKYASLAKNPMPIRTTVNITSDRLKMNTFAPALSVSRIIDRQPTWSAEDVKLYFKTNFEKRINDDAVELVLKKNSPDFLEEELQSINELVDFLVANKIQRETINWRLNHLIAKAETCESLPPTQRNGIDFCSVSITGSETLPNILDEAEYTKGIKQIFARNPTYRQK